MKIKSIVETTTSGSVATVATNMTPGKPLKRAVYGSKQVEGYQDTVQSRFDAQVKKYNATPIGPLDEAEIRENDVVVSPDKGSRTKTGLLSKDKNGILAKFVPPFKATGCWVSDKRGNRMSECETAEIASEVARVLNSEIKNPTAKEEVSEADDSAVGTGWSNAKALLQAYERKASAELQLGGDVVMLEYPEVRFVLGIYKQAVKDGRHEEILRLLADPYKFHKKQSQF